MIKGNFYLAIALLVTLTIASCSSESSTASSCPKAQSISFGSSNTNIGLYIDNATGINNYEVEYGLSGFSIGSGTTIMTSDNPINIGDLNPSTTYDFYVANVCSSESRSDAYEVLGVTTGPSECTGTASLTFMQSTPDAVLLDCSYDPAGPEKFEVEYGIHGFTLGTGTKLTTIAGESTLTVNSVQPDTQYDFYVRAVCFPTDASAFTKWEYTTISHCPKPTNLYATLVSGACSDSAGATRYYSWNYNYPTPAGYTISLVSGTNPPGSNTFTTTNEAVLQGGCYCDMTAFYVRADCTDGSHSDWAGPYYF